MVVYVVERTRQEFESEICRDYEIFDSLYKAEIYFDKLINSIDFEYQNDINFEYEKDDRYFEVWHTESFGYNNTQFYRVEIMEREVK